MKTSSKQQILLSEFQKTPTVTLARAVELVGGDIYYNQPKYVGEILKRMITNGWIEREARGVYRLKPMAQQPSYAGSVQMVKCTGTVSACMPSMVNWANERGLL